MCTYIKVCLTASDDAKLWTERGEALLPLMRCRCHIGSVRPAHRQAGWEAAAHSHGNDTALLLWEQLTERGETGCRKGQGDVGVSCALIWCGVLCHQCAGFLRLVSLVLLSWHWELICSFFVNWNFWCSCVAVEQCFCAPQFGSRCAGQLHQN